MNRIIELDGLRGVALLGIVLVNVFIFHAPHGYFGEFYGSFEGVQLNTVNWVVDLASGKFLFIFAFIFGFGLALQSNSGTAQTQPFLYKRMLILLVFGLLHILFFWFGDILTSYAILGLLTIPLLKIPNNYLLILALFFIAFRPMYYLGVVEFGWSIKLQEPPLQLGAYIDVFQNGSYMDIFHLRMNEFWSYLPENLVWYIPKTFGAILMGIYASRKQLFDRIHKGKSNYILMVIILAAISLFWIYNKMPFFSRFNLVEKPFWRPVLIGINVLFETLLSIGYIFVFALLFKLDNWMSRAFAETGRMALTNYVLQSVICIFIFYGFGLGNYGKLVPTELLSIAVCIFLFNMIFSHLYLRFYQQGPLEYLWRKLRSNI